MLEKKLLFGIEDIQGVCLECLTCKGRVRLPPAKLGVLPTQCPVCSIEWQVVIAGKPVSNSDYANFAFALRRLHEQVKQGSGMPFRVLLEFDEPS